MTSLEIETFRESFNYYFKGNQAAVVLCLDYFIVCHAWDDLIDRDVAISDNSISMAFKTLFHKIPNNPFYQQHAIELTPVMMNVIIQWEAANVLDKGSNNDQQKAYMLRAGFYSLISHIALICGGYEWVQEIAPEIYRLYGETIKTVYGETMNTNYEVKNDA